MKSMTQMQHEMLSKCKFDGSYPKPIYMGMGCIELANTPEEERELRKLRRLKSLQWKLLWWTLDLALLSALGAGIFYWFGG